MADGRWSLFAADEDNVMVSAIPPVSRPLEYGGSVNEYTSVEGTEVGGISSLELVLTIELAVADPVAVSCGDQIPLMLG